MSDGVDLRYAGRDEHFALRERVTVLESEIKRELTGLAKGLERVEVKLHAAPAQSSIDQFSLAMQHMASKMPGQGAPIPWRWICGAVFAVCGIVALHSAMGHF
jgi:hypothetical protein